MLLHPRWTPLRGLLLVEPLAKVGAHQAASPDQQAGARAQFGFPLHCTRTASSARALRELRERLRFRSGSVFFLGWLAAGRPKELIGVDKNCTLQMYQHL